MTQAAPSLFGQELDAAARKAGGWGECWVAHSVHVASPPTASPEEAFVVLVGAVCIGADKDGFPVFATDGVDRYAVMKLADYRGALRVEEAG